MERGRPPTSASGNGKLRLLALHSFRTSAKIFREQFARARMPEKLGSHVEVVFLDAPTPATGSIPRDVAPFFEGPYYEWFTVETMGDKLEYDAVKLDKSLRLVARTLREQGPFDGLVGFSQGSALASTVVALQASGDALLQGITPLSCCILFAGFRPRYQPHTHLWEKKIPIPSLHVFGDRDELRPACKELADAFENPLIVQHTRGHSIPALTGLQVAVFQAFFEVLKQQQPQQSSRQGSGTLTIPSAARASSAGSTQQGFAANGHAQGDGASREQEAAEPQQELKSLAAALVGGSSGSSPATPRSQPSSPQARL